jgi:hypothetical protein
MIRWRYKKELDCISEHDKSTRQAKTDAENEDQYSLLPKMWMSSCSGHALTITICVAELPLLARDI